MKQRPRIYYTEAQKSDMWDRWQNGESRTKREWIGYCGWPQPTSDRASDL